MCIICVKNKGVKAPTKEVIENMFYANPNGAGFAYVKNNRVIIHKGLMTLETFETALEKVYKSLGNSLQNTPFIYHFRITTSGGTKPQLTHPFPLSNKKSKLLKLQQSCDVAVAHNGIIDINIEKGLSDTATYIKNELSPYKTIKSDFYKSEVIQDAIEHRIDSKLAILSQDGSIVTIGNFEEDNGLLYSNTSYMSYRSFYTDWYSDTDTRHITVKESIKKPTGIYAELLPDYIIETDCCSAPLYNTKSRKYYIDEATMTAYEKDGSKWYDCGTVVDYYHMFCDDFLTSILDCTKEIVLK